MPKERERESFANLGDDIKAARQALNLSRRELAEMVNIAPRNLANIENSGSLPSLPVFYQLVKICKLPPGTILFPGGRGAGRPGAAARGSQIEPMPTTIFADYRGSH